MKKLFLEKFNSVSNSTKSKAFAIGCSVGTFLVTNVPVFAADGDLDPTVQAAISSGFTSSAKAITVVVGLGVAATIGVISMSGGAKAGLKWVKGIFAKAS